MILMDSQVWKPPCTYEEIMLDEGIFKIVTGQRSKQLDQLRNNKYAYECCLMKNKNTHHYCQHTHIHTHDFPWSVQVGHWLDWGTEGVEYYQVLKFPGYPL